MTEREKKIIERAIILLQHARADERIKVVGTCINGENKKPECLYLETSVPEHYLRVFYCDVPRLFSIRLYRYEPGSHIVTGPCKKIGNNVKVRGGPGCLYETTLYYHLERAWNDLIELREF